MKKLLKGKFFQNLLKPAVRGLVKQIPIIGTPIAEIVTNATMSKQLPKKHSTVSIVIQIVCMAAIIFAFYKKWIPLEQILEYMGFI